MTDYSLAELIIFTAAKAWKDDGEVLASGITPLPRLGASLAKRTLNPRLIISDGENLFAEEPVPVGPRAPNLQITYEGWAPYDRTFANLWSGKRHAMVAPVQMDRFGQANISVIGDHAKPKAALLGARGFPGNSISHPNSYFFPSHNKRALMAGEVDFVCMAGYNPARWLGGKKPHGLDLRVIISNLCVMDFGGPGNAIRLVSLHPGVSFDEVQDNTGFEVPKPDGAVPETEGPDEAALAEIRRLDPTDMRSKILKDNPPGRRG